MNTLYYGAASLITFLLAAKAHGRELRLEREAAGILRVVFMVLGLCSILRAGGCERGELQGSVAWWALVVGGFALVGLLGRRAGF